MTSFSDGESSIFFTSLFKKKKNLLVFFTLFLFCHLFSFILFFITFLLSSCRLFFQLDFSMVSPLEKTFSSHLLSPLPQFFSISLFSNCLFFRIFFSPLSLFLFSPFFFFPFFLHFSFLSWDPRSHLTVKHLHRHSSNRMLM